MKLLQVSVSDTRMPTVPGSVGKDAWTFIYLVFHKGLHTAAKQDAYVFIGYMH
jgi:hypothetical protein